MNNKPKQKNKESKRKHEKERVSSKLREMKM